MHLGALARSRIPFVETICMATVETQSLITNNELRKEEFAALYKEIEVDLKELSDLERNTVLAAALAYSWITTNAALTPPISNIAWAVPMLLPVYGAARTYAVIRQLWLRGSYLREVEEKHFDRDGGWQTYFGRAPNSIKTTNTLRIAFWCAFLALSVLASVVGGRASQMQAEANAARASVLGPAASPSAAGR